MTFKMVPHSKSRHKMRHQLAVLNVIISWNVLCLILDILSGVKL